MPASQKIITKLRERRQIEADLRKMLAAGSEPELQRQAQEIAALGSQVIPVLLGNLERAESRMLTTMGIVAAFLDRDEMIQTLRQVVLQPQSSDRMRRGAMTILEQFLGQPPDDKLHASLVDREGEAVSSLQQVLSQAQADPAVLIDFVQGLDQQEPDVVLGVVHALRDMGSRADPISGEQRAPVVEPLRMMAQDVRDEIATEAVQALGSIRLPEAARALQSLIPIVAPTLRSQAERFLRKLQFAGVEVLPLGPPPPEWRSLVSAVDGLGQQQVWFLQQNRWSGHTRFLNVLLSDHAGAARAVGHTQVPASVLPPRRELGFVHDFSLPDGSGAVLMLETSFELGRGLVAEALAQNRATQVPIAGPLRLLSPWLWEVGGGEAPSRARPKFSTEEQHAADRLLDHPAFATWTLRGEAIVEATEEIVHHPGWDLEIWVRRVAGELFSEPALVDLLHRRLVLMSDWLLLAGEELYSRLALAAAEAMHGAAPQDQPFARALVRRDLVLAIDSLKQEFGRPLGPERPR